MNITKNQSKTPLLTGTSVESKRAEIKAYFLNTWQTYDALFALINDDDAFYLRPEALRHPLIFYFGHTATFYINKLMLGKYINSRVNEKLEAICAVGVDEMSWDDLDSRHYDWPEAVEVRDYRKQVSELVCQLIDDMPLSLPIRQDSLAWIILMGCEHERIHLETSSVIMRMLPLNYLTPNEHWPTCPFSQAAPENTLRPVDGKLVEFGKPESHQTYGWDNEYGCAKLDVTSFNASQFLVSNSEFLDFVKAGGYESSKFWTEEGQNWLNYKQAKMPRFWFEKNGKYFQRNLLDEIELPLDWPVEVNYLEAKAFCNYLAEKTGKHIRLPSEAEWYCLRDMIPDDITEWKEAQGNINLEYFASSTPVNRFAHNGFFDIVGNVWQWTESPIDGFDGFEVHPLYDDFSTPTFDGKHNLIKGGSWISTGNEAIKYSRYAFRRHFFQHAGFRYVEGETADIPNLAVNQYERDTEVCQQLAASYGDSYLGFENYEQVLTKKVSHWAEQYQFQSKKCLDVGCRVGHSSFLLAKQFEHVDGVDFTARFIQFGVQLQTGQSVRFETVNQGEIVDYHEVSLAQLGLSETSENVVFSQGDASNLKPIFSGYDVIVVQQALEQNYDSKLVLELLTQRLNTDGYLIIVSDNQFDEQLSPKEKWLGGVKVNGENLTLADGITQKLKSNFEHLASEQLTKVVPINHNNFNVSQLDITLWKKN